LESAVLQRVSKNGFSLPVRWPNARFGLRIIRTKETINKVHIGLKVARRSAYLLRRGGPNE
jgi:hypothetical protein